MSILKKPYEISVWRDVPQSDGTFKEQKIAVIGSDTMTSQYRAAAPKFTRKTNGERELSFSLYRRYKDSMTGEEVINPFVNLVNNESKIKLKYDGKWYDFIIKDIQQTSSKRTITYTATDQWVNELSKNGYNLELATDLMNNNGTIAELATTILAETGWEIGDSDSLTQYEEETLVCFSEKDNPANLWYAFYSCCRGNSKIFQCIAPGDLGEMNTDGVYDNCIETALKYPKYVALRNPNASGLYAPLPGSYTLMDGTEFALPELVYKEITSLRANRIVYTQRSNYNPALNKYVYYYRDKDNSEIAGFTETEYISPNLIQNYVGNSTFKTASGWRGGTLTDISGAIEQSNRIAKATCTAQAVNEANETKTTLLDDLKNQEYDDGTVYTPCLDIKFPESEFQPSPDYPQKRVVVNSGFYDNRAIIGNLKPKQKFVLCYRADSFTTSNISVHVAPYRYSAEDSTYHTKYLRQEGDKTEEITITPFLKFDFNGTLEKTVGDITYNYIIAEVDDNYNYTEREFRNLKTQIFFVISDDTERSFRFYNFQIFEYLDDGEGNPLLPQEIDESHLTARAQTTYYYYKVDENSTDPGAVGYVSSQQDYKYCKQTIDAPYDGYEIDYTSDKYRTVEVSKSNYYNAIQSLCETFECWADFRVDHNAKGEIISKKVCFLENPGKENYGGFRYGTNLKDTKRSIDSKAFVSKLIVPDNITEVAENGYCSIARADSNISGENYIYNFSYYINQGMLDGEMVHELFYRPKNDGDTDILQGYYYELRALNDTINKYSDMYSALVGPLSQAEADYQAAYAGAIAAKEKCEDAETTFLLETGYDWTSNKLPSSFFENAELYGYLVEITEYKTAAQQYEADLQKAIATREFYNNLNEVYLKEIEVASDKKATLNKEFYKRFSRFIQEGTWTDSSYLDHDKYYIDAMATSYDSCLPKVSYTFDVIDLSSLPGYETLEFDLGDMTWVEDPEIFGSARESVVITEMTDCLDTPDKNTIKVQNYRNQFADLFQQTTATVQQVQYSSSAWERAANFTGSSAVDQAAYLQDALDSAELVLQNSGEQSVVWNKEGITVTDNDSPNKQIRIVGGAIMLRDEDGDGLGWKVGITSSGINAKLITAGQINTNVIQIMNGRESTFRWDSCGITAYDTTESNGYVVVNKCKGVRFDKWGIYSYELTSQDDSNFVPKSIDDIKKCSTFSLTEEGLSMKVGAGKYYYFGPEQKEAEDGSTTIEPPTILSSPMVHNSTAMLGVTDGYIYNKMTEGGIPLYDPTKKNTEFVKILSVKNDENNETVALYDNGAMVLKDVYLANVKWADTGAAFKNETSREYSYYCDSHILSEEELEKVKWSKTLVIPAAGQYQYIKTIINYSDGSSETSYSSSAMGADGAQGEPGASGAPGKDGTDGASIGTITMYQTSVWQDYETKPSAPVIPTTGAGDWTEDRVSIGLSTTTNLLWAVPVTKMIVDGNISYQDWGTPYLSEAYLNDAVDTKSYAEFLTLTNFGVDQGLSYNSDGKLYINANYINTGALIVSRKSGDPDDILFAAGWNNDGTPRLELGGFKVAPNGIALYTTVTGEKIDAPVMYTNLSATSLQRYLLTDTSYVLAPNGVKAFGSTFENNLPVDDTDGENFSLILGKKFGVTTNGILYATGANISGTITAEDGKIGGWTLAEGVLRSDTCQIDSSNGGIQAPQASFDNLSIKGTLSVRNLSVSSDILKVGKITINGSISDSYLEFPNGMTLTSIKGASASSASYSISYNDNETGNTLTITATTTATKHPEFSLKGSVIINYPGLVATTESIAYNYEIIIPINESKGQVTIYGMPGGSFGTITHPPTTVTYYTPSSASFLKINSENNSLSLYTNGEYIYFGGSDEDKHPYIQTVARGNTVVNNMYGSWIVQGTMSGNITTSSDCRLKTDILSFDTAHSQFFDALKPVSFAYKSKPGTHFGFIAQDVLEGLRAANIDSSAIVGSYVEDDAEYLTLSYTDIIALNTSQIQQLKKRVAELEATVENLSRKFDIC